MKKMIKIIRKVDVLKQHEKILIADQDYWLGSLYVAIQDGDIKAKAEAIKQLKSLGRELEILRYEMRG